MRRRLRDSRLAKEQSGLTLVELLVVIAMATVTALALFAFQDIVLRQTNQVFARVDATQDARIAIEKIASRLHSSCVAEDVAPILAGSDGNNLMFVSEYGSAASLTPDKHVISLSGTTLTDTTYLVTGGSPPDWTFSTTPATNPPPQEILSAVTAAPGKPAFTYYGYGVAKDSAGNNYLSNGQPYMMLLDGTSTLPSGVTTSTGAPVPAGTMPANSPSPLPTPLSAANAQFATEVVINLVVDADGNLGQNPNNAREDLTVTDSIALRITPVPTDNNQELPAPCE